MDDLEGVKLLESAQLMELVLFAATSAGASSSIKDIGLRSSGWTR